MSAKENELCEVTFPLPLAEECVYRSITAPNIIQELWSKSGMKMLLLTFWILTSLISSIHAGVSSPVFMFSSEWKSKPVGSFRGGQQRETGSPFGYTHIECGLRPSYESFLETGKRITGGRYAKAGEFPWQVSIQSNGKHICGGTMISALWILTAAHCFADEVPPDLTVAVGGIDLDLPLEEHKPDSLVIHENFDRISMKHDIALIMLSSPIKFSNEKIPICLPFMYDIDTWQHCWIAGWGTTGAAEVSASHVLQKARMKLISKEQCLERIPQLPENMLCAELEGGERGTCQVDSGGPLVCSYWNTMKWFQVGIISWEEDCTEKPSHEIYTSVYNYYGWIMTETAVRGKPFFIEGVDNRENAREVPSRAQAQLVFLEYSLLLFASLTAIRLL